MSKSTIHLGGFLKKENWEFHYALSEEPDQKLIACFREVCSDEKITADIKGLSVLHELGKINHFASITGGLSDAESKIRARLEDIIQKANKKHSEIETDLASKQ